MTQRTISSLRSRLSSDRPMTPSRSAVKTVQAALVAVSCLGLALSVSLWLGTGQAAAQDLGRAVSQIVTIDRQQLFPGTAYGRRVLASVEAERKRLAEENRRVEAQLLQEERDLTKQRETLTPQAFRALATEFDERVRALRAEGTTREQEFVRIMESEQAAFFDRIGPILGQLLREIGAVVILDRRAILLTTQNVDITARAVARIDEALGDGTQLDEAAPPEQGDTTPNAPDIAPSDPPQPSEPTAPEN